MLLLSLVFLWSCDQERVPEQSLPLDTRENYVEALHQLDLVDTALGRRWLEAGEQAVQLPVDMEAPLEELVIVEAHRPAALGYRFPGRRGRRITIEIESDMDRFFADVYRDDEQRTPVASLHGSSGEITFEPQRDNHYILRLQPELLRDGRFTLRFVAEAALHFPVEGVGEERIYSFFGDPRDGGRRIHEGVDIFAPRGTPLLATSDAVVFRVGWRDRGGNIVSLRDTTRDLMIYYAHLDEQLVVEGQRVSAGDVIGTVGNTGNARTTPPHLHIGVYQGSWRNAVDPWDYFVDPPVTVPVSVSSSRAESLGAWYVLERPLPADTRIPVVAMAPRFINRNPFLNLGPAVRSATGLPEVPEPAYRQTTLTIGTPVQIVGVSGSHVRVRTEAGEEWITTLPQLEQIASVQLRDKESATTAATAPTAAVTVGSRRLVTDTGNPDVEM